MASQGRLRGRVVSNASIIFDTDHAAEGRSAKPSCGVTRSDVFSNTGILLEVPLAAIKSGNPSAQIFFFEGEGAATGATAVMNRCCFSALRRAAARGNEEVVWPLIKNGAGLEMPIQEHRTPLMLAEDGEHQVLLWKRAKIHAKPERAGIAALSEAVEIGKEYSARLLSQYRPELEALVTGEQSLGRAAKQGNLTTVRELGAKGAKVDGDRKLSSSLILAVENGHHLCDASSLGTRCLCGRGSHL